MEQAYNKAVSPIHVRYLYVRCPVYVRYKSGQVPNKCRTYSGQRREMHRRYAGATIWIVIIIGGKSDEDEKQSRIGTDDAQKGTYCRYDFLLIQRF